MPAAVEKLGISWPYALRTPQAAGPRLFRVCRYAGFLCRASAMASASDSLADVTWAGAACGVVGWCATATAAGPIRRPATINTCFMVVLEKICREVEAPYARVREAVSACDKNLVGTTRAARSTAGQALGAEVSGGDFDFHESAGFIQPEIDRVLTLSANCDVPQAGRGPVPSGRSNPAVADLGSFARGGPREERRGRSGGG